MKAAVQNTGEASGLQAATGVHLPRLDSVDFVRGLVMIIMALDHTRDFFSDKPFPPEIIPLTSGPLFFTRWVTHFCAPTFFLLAGTGAYLSATRGKTTEQLSRFLWTRGL